MKDSATNGSVSFTQIVEFKGFGSFIDFFGLKMELSWIFH
jgi:hypothetical protein